MLSDKSQKQLFLLSCHAKKNKKQKQKVGLLAYFTISVVSSTAISIYDIGEHFLMDGIHPYSEFNISVTMKNFVIRYSFG